MDYRWKQLLRKQRLIILLLCLASAYFFLLWTNMLVVRSEGLYAGHPYVWADWSMHIGMVSHFAYTPVSNWFDNHPFYAGAPLSYPFATNMLSALLVRLQFSLPFAMLAPSFLLSLWLIFALFRFSFLFTRNQKSAIAMVLLFLCSGGLGFFFANLADSHTVLTQIPEKGIEFTNIFMGMLLPQRAFLLGMPVGLFVLTVVIRFFLTRVTHKQLLSAGLVAGLLPVIHTHTFIVIGLFSVWIFAWSWRKYREWLWFGVPAVVVSSILYGLFVYTPGQLSFFSFHPGWMVETGIIDWLVFWVKNWGIFLFLALAGTVFLLLKNKKMAIICGGWWLIFFIANLIQFQPQTWDNSKIFAWVYLGLCIPVIFCISQLIRRKQFLLATTLVIVCSFSGAFDLLHLLDFQSKTYQMLSSDQISIAEWVRANTAQTAIFLTPDVVANPIVMIAGRSVVLGYPGWVFSYGLSSAQRESDRDVIYTFGPAPTLLEKYGVTHLLIGPDQIAPKEQYLKLLIEQGGWSVYQVTK